MKKEKMRKKKDEEKEAVDQAKAINVTLYF